MLLLQGTESLNRASQSIERSHQIAAETDQIGTDIIEELGEQREQLERTKGRVSTNNDITARHFTFGNNLISSMYFHVNTLA